MSAMFAAEPPAIETLTFEAALKELESIVSRLEQGEVDLEDSIVLYERGQADIVWDSRRPDKSSRVDAETRRTNTIVS